MKYPERFSYIVELGYKAFCEEVKELMVERLRDDGLVIFERFESEKMSDVKAFCNNHGIDLLGAYKNNDSVVKAQIGLGIIENHIKYLMSEKKSCDEHLKRRGGSSKKLVTCITNGIENAPWLVLFGKTQEEFGRKISLLVEMMDPVKDTGYQYITMTANRILHNWVDYKDPVPDIKNYHMIVNTQVPAPIHALVEKHFGN